MLIIQLVGTLIAEVLRWAINAYLPMDPTIGSLINLVVAVML
jgi:hypothetical protein